MTRNSGYYTSRPHKPWKHETTATLSSPDFPHLRIVLFVYMSSSLYIPIQKVSLYTLSFTLFCHKNHTTAIINDKTLFKTLQFEVPPMLGLQTNNRLALTLPPSQLCPGKLHLPDLDFIMTSVTNDYDGHYTFRPRDTTRQKMTVKIIPTITSAVLKHSKDTMNTLASI